MKIDQIGQPIREKLNALWQDKLAPRYHALSEREQRTVLIAAVLLPFIVLVFGVVLPMLDANKAYKAELSRLSTQVAEANHLADLLASQPRSATTRPNNNNMLGQVDNIARQAGVRDFMTRLRPQQVLGDKQRLHAQLKQVPYQKFTRFITMLEKQGYRISQLKIQAAGKGIVHAQATIGR